MNYININNGPVDLSWMTGPLEYDNTGCRVDREEALKPFKGCTGKMAMAYSYWINLHWEFNDRHVPDEIQQTCPQEVQQLREHLWKAINEDLDKKSQEAKEQSCTRCLDGHGDTLAKVVIFASLIFIAIYLGVKLS